MAYIKLILFALLSPILLLGAVMATLIVLVSVCEIDIRNSYQELLQRILKP